MKRFATILKLLVFLSILAGLTAGVSSAQTACGTLTLNPITAKLDCIGTNTGSGIVHLTTGSGAPAQGSGCAVPSVSNLTYYFDLTNLNLWQSIAASGTCWQRVLTTNGIGPLTLVGATGSLTSGPTASLPTCNAGAANTFYLDTDGSHTLQVCTNATGSYAWSSSLNPSGSYAIIFNSTSGNAECYNSSGTSCFAAGGGGGSVFTGSTATAPTFSATPTFSLADVSVKSPLRVEFGALTANVTSVTITNKTAGAKFSIVWTQDGTGGRTVAYGASVTSGTTCTVDPTASDWTEQFFEVAADGTTVNGAGCWGNNPNVVLPGSLTMPFYAGTGNRPLCVNASGLIYAGTNTAGVLACP